MDTITFKYLKTMANLHRGRTDLAGQWPAAYDKVMSIVAKGGCFEVTRPNGVHLVVKEIK